MSGCRSSTTNTQRRACRSLSMPPPLYSRFRAALPLVALSLLALPPADGRADYTPPSLTDPATLQIGGTLPPPGNDPNLVGSSGLINIYQNQGGAGNLT